MPLAMAAPPTTHALKGRRKRAAIVGAGLGGLSAAIHLRLAGHEVTMFERNRLAGGRANLLVRNGFQFDTGPSLLNYPWVFEELFRAAGRNFYDYVTLSPVDPSITFQWRDGTTLRLSSDRAFLARELERFETGAARRVEGFFRDAAEKYRIAFERLACRNEDSAARWLTALSVNEALRTGMWRSLYGELSRFFRSRYVLEALGSYSMYLGGSPFQLPGLFTILPYGEMAYGLWLPKGGIYGLVRGVEQLARELGVTIHTDAHVTRIESRAGGVSGVRVAGGHREPAGIVVSNLDLPSTETELLGKRAPKLTMTPAVVTFYWGVRGRPAGLGHHTIFLPDNYRKSFEELLKHGSIPTDLPFYVSVPSSTDSSLAPAGDSCVFVLVPVPILSRLGDIDWDEAIARIRGQVLARLRHHGVALAESIVTEQCYTPQEWRSRFGLFDGSAFGAAHTLSQVGPFRPANWSHTHPGLYFAGSSTTPGAGMPMVVLGGKMTAERIATHVR
ncbi:MAG: phytoene desaturase family protein [Bryobacteraceae bacterium]